MRRLAASCVLAAAVAVSGAGCNGPGAAADTEPVGGNFSLEQARAFEDFSLYALGETFDDLPLTAVERRFDGSEDAPPVRANFVDFIYGSCEPAPEVGCAPPLSVQVWAACERNPLSYDPLAGQEEPIEVRGVPAYFYESRERLELSTGASTVVIFAADRASALAAAAALRGVNNSVAPGQDLPAPTYTQAEGGIVSVVPCAYEDPKQQIEQDPAKARRVARALADELAAGAARNDNPAVRSVECFRSPVPTRVGAIADVHECSITWDDGAAVTWCVLSGEKELLRATLPDGCEQAASGDSSFVPAVDSGANAARR